MAVISERDGAVTFEVKVQPRASRTALAGQQAGAIRLSVAAPPVEGKANEECRRFLAELLGVRRSAVEIVSGASSRTKVIRVRGIAPGSRSNGICHRVLSPMAPGLLNFREEVNDVWTLQMALY
jgi:hypothetical protein